MRRYRLVIPLLAVMVAGRSAGQEATAADDVLRQADERDRSGHDAAEEERRRLEQRLREERERAALEEAQRAAEAEARAARERAAEARLAEVRTKRTWARVLLGAAALSGGGAAWFAYQGGRTNDEIRKGGYPTASAIVDASNSGKTYNALAIGFGVGAVAALAVGAPLYLANWRDPPLVSVVPARGGAVVAVAASIP